MKVILDTRIFLWVISDPDRISPRARKTLEDPRNEVFLSIASAWEITIKAGIGRLSLPAPAAMFIQRQLAKHRIDLLPIQLSHLGAMEKLPPHHRDPFDRLLVAQCIEEGAVLLTVDSQLQRYPVEILN